MRIAGKDKLLARHLGRLAMSVAMQYSHDQALRQTITFCNIDRFGDDAIQIGDGLVDCWAQWQCVM
jgi:hypothetical protein